MKEWIRQEISETIIAYRNQPGISTSWRQPVVGFADAQDELFLQLKEVISPSHYSPTELLATARTVITYFLPFNDSIPRSNPHNYYASREWELAYVETNQLIRAINQHLAQALQEKGYQCVVLPPTHNFDKEKLISDWSHKHIAYIAGLGKFGLHTMLITEEGCSGRLGSLITEAYIEPTPRNAVEGCLYNYNKTCQICIKRCPNGALTEKGFDGHKCYVLLMENAERNKDLGLADACGKCISMVPCSFMNPVNKLLQKKR
jgi:epoxyqueuosine reductase QueG